MSEEAPKLDKRFRLGPKAMAVLDRLEDFTPPALDAELARLETLEADRKRAISSEQRLQGIVENLSKQLDGLVSCQGRSIDAIDGLHDKVDQRTAQLVKMHQHTSGLIGSRLTEGAERKRLLGQFQGLYEKIEQQVEQITALVAERLRHARAHLEDARREGLDMVQVAEPALFNDEQARHAEPVIQTDRGRER